MEQRATSQGAPPRVPSPGLARCQGPRGATGYKQPGAQGASGKRSLARTTPLLGPQKRSGGVKHPPHDGRGATAQAGSHQKNRREQKFASCSGLGFRILQVEAAAGRGRAALVMQLLLEAPAGRLEAQTQRGPLWGRQNHLLQGVEHRGEPPAWCLCPWGLESGAVGAAGPRASQAGSAGGRAGVRKGCRRA